MYKWNLKILLPKRCNVYSRTYKTSFVTNAIPKSFNDLKNTTYETHDVRMKSQNFFQQKLFPVIDSEGVRRALRVKVGPGEVGVGVEVCQQVVGHQPELVAIEKRRCELKWNNIGHIGQIKTFRGKL